MPPDADAGAGEGGAAPPVAPPPPVVDRTAWVAMALKRHPEVRDLRERLFTLDRSVALSRDFGVARSVTLRKETTLQLVMQHLELEGFASVVRSIEEEANVKYLNLGQSESQLRFLLRRAIRRLDSVWELSLADTKALFERRVWQQTLAQQKTQSQSVRQDPDRPGQTPGPEKPLEFDDFVLEREDLLFEHVAQELQLWHDDDLFNNKDEYIWDEPPNNPNNIIFDKDAQHASAIKAASLNKLVEQLTPMHDSDLQFMKTFLLTYQSFMRPETLLVKLMHRYRVPTEVGDQGIPEENAMKIKMRVVNVMKNWIEEHFDDFDDKLIRNIRVFIDQLREDELPHLARILHTALAKKESPKKKVSDFSFNAAPPEPKVPKNVFHPNLSIFDVADEEIARQLTIIESEMFNRIQSSELLNLAWSKAKYKHRARNVLAMIARFNTISAWVSSTIIAVDRVKDRAKVFGRFINICEHLRNLNNFSSLQAILSGFGSASVHRLKYTREELTSRQQQLFEDITELMSSHQNHKVYREAVKNCAPPKVPYLGVYLTDLTFIEDGNQDHVVINDDVKLINFSKRKKIVAVIQEIQRNQQTPYNLLPVTQILRLSHKFPNIMDEKQLYRLSLAREPRNADREEIM